MTKMDIIKFILAVIAMALIPNLFWNILTVVLY